MFLLSLHAHFCCPPLPGLCAGDMAATQTAEGAGVKRRLFDSEEVPGKVPRKCHQVGLRPTTQSASGANASIGLLGLDQSGSESESEDADDYARVFPELLEGLGPLRPGGASGAGLCQSDLDELIDVGTPDAVETSILLDIFEELTGVIGGAPPPPPRGASGAGSCHDEPEDALLAPMTVAELAAWL